MNHSNLLRFIVFIFMSIIIASCTYEKIEEEEGLPENVSFQNDLIPMFNASCNSVGCHNDGGIPPDLSPANAYKDLTSTAGMIDITTPENSELYKRMVDAAQPMPISGLLSTYQSDQVLSWITDGAIEN